MTDFEVLISRTTTHRATRGPLPTPTFRIREAAPADIREPQALVLILTTTICENCGRQHHSHNQHMMVRYGSRTYHAQSIKHTKAECERFTHLPRETKTFITSSPFCPECF
jgi:hypothetical protein